VFTSAQARPADVVSIEPADGMAALRRMEKKTPTNSGRRFPEGRKIQKEQNAKDRTRRCGNHSGMHTKSKEKAAQSAYLSIP
jgi:hypothetical protein